MSFWSQRRDETPSTQPSSSESQQPARPSTVRPTPQKAAKRAPQASTPAAAQPATLIATGSTFIGEITGNTELLIRGVVKGEIDLESRVVVGKEGRVEGDIRAQSIEIAGKVNGNIRCESLLKVHSSGSLEGEVVTVDLDVDSGCFLSGRVQRVAPGEVSPKKSAPKPAPKPAAAGAERADGAPSGGGEARSPAGGETASKSEPEAAQPEAAQPDAAQPAGEKSRPDQGNDSRQRHGRHGRQRHRQGQGAPAGKR